MKKFIFATIVALFAACTTDTTEDIAIAVPQSPEALTVSFEEDSRVQLNEEQKTVWTAGDCVSVFYRSDAHDKYEFQGETGDTDGTLKRVKRGTPSIGLDKVVAVYPYNEEYLIELQTGNIQALLPDTQHYQKDSYGVGSSIMISSSRSDRLHLKNVCGWLKLQLTGEDVVKSIKLKGNNGEQLAGNIFITADDATCTLAADLNEKYGDESGDLSGSLVDATTILTEVTLDCGDGVTLTAEPTTFYIALPPQTFEKGLTVDIENNYNSSITKSTDNSITISRNTIHPMDCVKVNLQPNNEIWYTSADGEVVSLMSSRFDVNIVSNTFKNGMGVIVFDGELTRINSNAFSGCSKLTSVTIPDSVTSIGSSAFSGCSNLTSVTIPDSVTTLDANPFRYCNNLAEFNGKFASEDKRCLIVDGVLNSFAPAGLTEYTIPNSVTSIGVNAFIGCSSLTSVTLPNSVTSVGLHPFYECTNLTEFNGKFASLDKRCLIVDGVLNSFAIGCGVTEYTIPYSVTSIANSAFRNCSSLTSITIPNSVTSIGNEAFYGCMSLISVTIPNSVTTIGSYTFYNCSSLANVTIPDGVTLIGWFTFSRCRSLTSVTIGNSVTSIGDYAFSYCDSLKTVTIPNSVTSIGDEAFYSCIRLTTVTIPDSVTSIGNSAFYDCSSLTSATIGNGVTTIGERAFYNCSSLASIVIPNSVTSIGKSAFYNCNSLTSITIGNSVTLIGNAAFSRCSSLESITIPDSVTSIGEKAFYGCKGELIINSKIVETNYDSSNQNIWLKGSKFTKLTIGNSVTSIGDYAFYYYDSLTSVTIPDSVTSIGNGTFYGCSSLASVYCKPTTPPTGNYHMFTSNASGRKIYVPRASESAYEAADGWSDYAADIEPYDFE